VRAAHRRLETALEAALAEFGAAAGAQRAVAAVRGATRFVQHHGWSADGAAGGKARTLDVLLEGLDPERTHVCFDRRQVLTAAHRTGVAAEFVSGVFVPLRGEITKGMLALTRRTPWDWPHETVDAAERLAETVAAALDRMASQSTVAREQEARYQAEAETRRLREQLAHAGRVTMLGELAASLAHELNQPLTAIYTNVQAMARFLDRRRPALVDARATLDDLGQDCRRAAEVLGRLRQMFRRQDTERVPLAMEVVSEHVLRLLHEDAVARGVTVALEVARDLPLVNGDRVQLEQVVMNLLVNAFDAVAAVPDDRLVTVRIGAAGGLVRVAVLDTGKGIPAVDLDRVFEPFFTRKPNGMGIGLAICRTIVEAHGGRIVARNRADRGSCFEVSLPAAQGVPATAGGLQ
jgi:C4-dicarboxylate-specific signal transduction histidine kinase